MKELQRVRPRPGVGDAILNDTKLTLSFPLFQNSIRHNLSLHSRFIRVQNEGTGKSSWWMLNPDAKMASGKSSRRRPPSIDGAGGGQANGRSGANGGSEFKNTKRGRSKKDRSGGGGGGGGGGGMAARNARMAAAAAAAAAAANASHQSPLTDLYPGGGPPPPAGVEYPFSGLPGDVRSRMLDFSSPGGRIGSPPPAGLGMPRPPTPPHEFGYPAQEWSSDYQHCNYYPSKMFKSKCKSMNASKLY